MRYSLRGFLFYGLVGALLLTASVTLTATRSHSAPERRRAWLHDFMVPDGAARDMTLAPFTYSDLRLAPGDSLDLLLQWMPPAMDSATAAGAVDSLVTVFRYGTEDGGGLPTVQVFLRVTSLYAIDRSWIQRVPVPRMTGSAWLVTTSVDACAVIHRTWPAQQRDVWGALVCTPEQFVERRRNDASLRVYRENPAPYDMGPGFDRYPPRPRVPVTDSVIRPAGGAL